MRPPTYLPACSPKYESRRHPAGQDQDFVEGKTQGEVGLHSLHTLKKVDLTAVLFISQGFAPHLDYPRTFLALLY